MLARSAALDLAVRSALEPPLARPPQVAASLVAPLAIAPAPTACLIQPSAPSPASPASPPPWLARQRVAIDPRPHFAEPPPALPAAAKPRHAHRRSALGARRPCACSSPAALAAQEVSLEHSLAPGALATSPPELQPACPAAPTHRPASCQVDPAKPPLPAAALAVSSALPAQSQARLAVSTWQPGPPSASRTAPRSPRLPAHALPAELQQSPSRLRARLSARQPASSPRPLERAGPARFLARHPGLAVAHRQPRALVRAQLAGSAAPHLL